MGMGGFREMFYCKVFGWRFVRVGIWVGFCKFYVKNLGKGVWIWNFRVGEVEIIVNGFCG